MNFLHKIISCITLLLKPGYVARLSPELKKAAVAVQNANAKKVAVINMYNKF